MQKWQYVTETANHVNKDKLNEILNKYGVNGWELVAATESENYCFTLIFKRQIA